MYSLTPWLGSYAFLALERFLRIRCAERLGLKGFDSMRPYYMQFTMQVSEADFHRILREEIARPIDPMELLYPNETPVFDKYDDTLPPELTRRGFAYGVLEKCRAHFHVPGIIIMGVTPPSAPLPAAAAASSAPHDTPLAPACYSGSPPH